MTGPRARRVVVVGGGLSGLAFAHALEIAFASSNADTGLEITLLERSAFLGGAVQTRAIDGFLVEIGADGWVANKPQATELAKKVGLENDLIETIAANRRVFVLWNDRLVAVPRGMVLAVPTRVRSILASPLFSWRGKARIALEAAVPPRVWNDDDDESIAEFATRRFGAELTERLAAPLLGGIVSGEASDLSIRATFPQLVQAEKDHGSLIRGMIGRRAALGGSPPSAFLSIRGGMGAFASAIAESLRHTRIRVSASARAIADAPEARDAKGRYVVETDEGERFFADAVIVAAPFGRARSLLTSLDRDLAAPFDAIGEVDATVAALAFRRDQIDHSLDATGFLVPRVLGRPIVASTFVSSKWPNRAPVGHVLLRAFLRSTGDVDLQRADDDRIARVAIDELRRAFPIQGAPLFTRISRARRPHLRVGHLARVRMLTHAIARHKSIALLASGIDGIGIPDCIRAATEAAHRICASITTND
jgi:oxygen-dependent protoporphyrinogen oxidase